MRKFKRLTMTLALLIMAVGGAWAQEQSETFATTASTVEGTHFIISNNGQNADSNGMSAKEGITVTSKNGENITKVVITCVKYAIHVNDNNTFISSGTKTMTYNGEESTTVTATGVNATTFTFTCNHMAGLQFNQFVVYFGDAAIDVTPVAGKTNEWTFTMPAFDVELEVEYDTDYAKSINIEQLVLDNGKEYDIAKAFLENYVDAQSINALDSLNDEKILRNEPYLGLKLKTEGASVKVLVEAGKTLKVKFGFIGEAVKVFVDGVQGESVEATTEGCVEEFAAAEADRVIEFVTASTKTVVIKQIMVDEAIKDVTLPAATRYEVKIAEGIANGTVSFDATSKKDSKGYVTVAVGDEVTITATPAEGYELESVSVTGVTTDQAVVVTNGKFTMPTNDAVTINATFEESTAVSEVKANSTVGANAPVKYFKGSKLVIEGANGSEFDAAGAQVK